MSGDRAMLLDLCVREVRAGRLTVEQCLDRLAEDAAELEPLLHLALALNVSGIPEPEPAARRRIDARLRASMIAVPALARARWWQRPGVLGLSRLPSPRQLTIVAGSAAALLLALGGGGVTVAAQRAAPGDALYGLRRATERVEVFVRHEPPIDRYDRLAGRRLSDVQAALTRGDESATRAASEDFATAYERLLSAAHDAGGLGNERGEKLAAARVLELGALRDRSPLAATALAPALARIDEAQARALAGTAGPVADAAAKPPAAAGAVPANVAVEPRASAAVERAGRVAGVFAELQMTVDRAEAVGALTPAQAGEVRALLRSARTLQIGGDNAVVAAAVARLGAAIADCADRGCAAADALDALYGRVAGSATALGLVPPRQPAARVVPPAVGGAPAPVATATRTSPPSTPAAAAAGTGAGPAPTVAAAAPVRTSTPETTAAPRTATPIPAARTVPATPATTGPAAATTATSPTLTATVTAGAVGVAATPASAPVAATPALAPATATATATPTGTPSPSPAATANGTSAPSAIPSETPALPAR